MWKCIHAYVAYVFICPASLCLLLGAFNLFTFKVIIHMYPVTIFLIVLRLFSVGLFFVLFFLPRKVSFAFAVKLVWCAEFSH